jgi:RNA polymerase sigma factor (sigma-70 family)
MNSVTHLIDQCAKGDSKSQEELYDLLKGRLMGVCLRYNRDQDEANDVFQETMIRVFRNTQQAKNVNNLMAWVTRIASNVAIDVHKRKRTEIMVNIEESEVGELTSNEIDIIETMKVKEILQLLGHLPPNYRLVFNLYIIDGYTHKEISDQLEIAESTSRVILTRAKRRLGELLKKTELSSYVHG